MTFSKYFDCADEAELDRTFKEWLQKDLAQVAAEAGKWLSECEVGWLDVYRLRRLGWLIDELAARLPSASLGVCMSRPCTNPADWESPSGQKLCAVHYQKLLDAP